ncbi:MAG: hypothetical protein J5658_07520 [Prevotella sp.]|nr:hypothetical protein [Prevotella sp.]
MEKRIRKSDDFYQEALIWMGYRYAIGLTNFGRFKGEEQIVEYFDSWRRKYGCEDEFPYEKLKRPVDSYEKNPQICTSICEEYIVEDNLYNE